MEQAYPFGAYIGSYTSDHTEQYITVTLGEVRLTGYTWNLLERAKIQFNRHGKVSAQNNPFGVTETLLQYQTRKLQQIEQIIESLQNANTPIDFMFLQEADFLNFSDRNDEKLDLNHRKDFIALKKQLARVFKKQLKKLGCDFVFLGRNQKDCGKNQAIVYYKKRLKVVRLYKLFPTKQGKFTALEGHFKIAGQQIALVNLHLECALDYSEAIKDYQLARISEHLPTISGGDTNHQPGVGIDTLIAAPNYQRVSHLNAKKIPKYYDGFMVSTIDGMHAQGVVGYGRFFEPAIGDGSWQTYTLEKDQGYVFNVAPQSRWVRIAQEQFKKKAWTTRVLLWDKGRANVLGLILITSILGSIGLWLQSIG